MRRNGFGDESAKGGEYAVLVALTSTSDVNAARTLARSLCKPGARRLHMTKEKDSYRKTVLDVILRSGLVTVWVAHGKGVEAAVRARCLQQLVGDLGDLQLTRLILESREGRDHQDRQVLAGCGLQHDHLQPHEDPALWLADALAWSFTHGGARRAAIEDVTLAVRDVGTV